jgi:hypothetical protein
LKGQAEKKVAVIALCKYLQIAMTDTFPDTSEKGVLEVVIEFLKKNVAKRFIFPAIIPINQYNSGIAARWF